MLGRSPRAAVGRGGRLGRRRGPSAPALHHFVSPNPPLSCSASRLFFSPSLFFRLFASRFIPAVVSFFLSAPLLRLSSFSLSSLSLPSSPCLSFRPPSLLPFSPLLLCSLFFPASSSLPASPVNSAPVFSFISPASPLASPPTSTRRLIIPCFAFPSCPGLSSHLLSSFLLPSPRLPSLPFRFWSFCFLSLSRQAVRRGSLTRRARGRLGHPSGPRARSAHPGASGRSRGGRGWPR